MTPGESRIVKALSGRVMTVAELEATAYVNQKHIRKLLAKLAKAGVVQIAGQATRAARVGSLPNYWELTP
jgi:transcription initiation factor IIE alpha subunit